MKVFLWFVAVFLPLALAQPVNLRAEEEENEVDNGSESDLFNGLMHLGAAIFGTPDVKSGEAVSTWKETSQLNPEEMGEYAEGDILHPIGNSRNGLKAVSSRWPKGIIPYEISPSFGSSDRQMILSSIDEYKKLTCLKFTPRTSYDTDYIYFTNGNTGCWSSVGKIGGRQEINLQTPGCLSKKGTVMHEMLHAAGFMHEQNRPDRDKYVTVNYNNIQSGRENNFEKAQSSMIDSQGIGYDYRSVMHYSANAFSKNGQATIDPKTQGVTMGQREGLSRKDIQKIQKMYNCKNNMDSDSDSGSGNNLFGAVQSWLPFK
ncbi:zinc metalloproteinase nas-13-like [Rhopalosiphum padi]|uniref:zinc metalloproteinase nas-13-like n=1 Tax=Rhopalosiphum padi TaxID=40932 RepID=UPI00298E43E9|nr:zinc metalloproteinase nas-13-like [Rhopalosiphum padi]